MSIDARIKRLENDLISYDDVPFQFTQHDLKWMREFLAHACPDEPFPVLPVGKPFPFHELSDTQLKALIVEIERHMEEQGIEEDPDEVGGGDSVYGLMSNRELDAAIENAERRKADAQAGA